MTPSAPIIIPITRIDADRTDIPLPSYATPGSSGMDLCAAINEEVVIAPMQTVLIATGFKIELPEGYEGQVRPRSGLAIKHAIGIMNSPGTIDSDYRGEIKIIITNFGAQGFTIRRGDRIAQFVVAPVSRVSWSIVGDVSESSRGAGGFGHSGV